MADGSVVCAGQNNVGQLGVPYAPQTYLPQVIPGLEKGDAIRHTSKTQACVRRHKIFSTIQTYAHRHKMLYHNFKTTT